MSAEIPDFRLFPCFRGQGRQEVIRLSIALLQHQQLGEVDRPARIVGIRERRLRRLRDGLVQVAALIGLDGGGVFDIRLAFDVSGDELS